MDTTNTSYRPPPLSFTFDGRPLTYLQATWLDFDFVINRIPGGKVTLSRPGSPIGDRSGEAADAGFCQPGSKIEIKAGLGALLFTGRVVEQELEWTEAGGVQVTLKFRHDLHQLTLVHRSQVHGGDKEMTDADIVRGMLTEHKIAVGALTGMAVSHAQMVQYECTDWCFLKARLSANGVWLVPTLRGADIVEPKLADMPTHTLNLSRGTLNSVPVEEAKWTFSVDEQAAELRAASWDIEQQKMAGAAIGRLPNPIGKNGLDPARQKTLLDAPWALRHSVSMAPGEQTALVNGRLLAQYGAGVRGSFVVWGTTQFEIGQTLEITGLGGHFNGVGLISGVGHKMEQGYWRTIITLGQELCCDLDASVVPRIAGLHVGVVAQHEPDLKSLNRLRVVVPALGLDNKPLWARFAAPYASKDSGVCFYPEPGDEVVLGFFENDPRYPVVLGAMHNPKNEAPFPPETARGRKGVFFDKDGQIENVLNLRFDLEKKEASLQSGNQVITLDPKWSIRLTTINDKPISLKATKGIKLDGGAQVEITGKKIDLSN